MERRCNFHTHTYLCQHAQGTVDEMCESALQNNLAVLGFSDHAPQPDGRWPGIRMRWEQLDDYIRDIRLAQQKYSGKMKILQGLECEYIQEFKSIYRDEFLGRLKFDYLIGAAHFYRLPDGSWKFYKNMTDEELCWATDIIIETMESGLFLYLAHHDIFGCGWRGWNKTATDCSRAICQVAKQLNLPLEINALGMRKPEVEDEGVMRHPYPLRKFWEIAAEEKVEVVLGADAHYPQDIWRKMDEAEEWARYYELPIVNEKLAEKLTLN